MKTEWSEIWRGLRLRIESRQVAGGGGNTLRVGSPDDEAEWLRFDCFDLNPHWHLDPAGIDQVAPLDERRDVEQQVFEQLRHHGVDLLRKAKAPEAVLNRFAQNDPENDDVILREAERALRHRPTDFDELDLAVLRARRSEKWHTYPEDVLPAWVAEMDFPLAAPIQAELERFTQYGDVGYPIGLRETGLAEVFCSRMAERFDWHPDPDRVEILSEVVQGMYLALEAFSEPGDGVVVQTPIYPPFLGSIQDMKRRLVENRMTADGDRLEFDFDGLSALVDPDAKLFLFCNPHNPSGRVLGDDDLERIARFAIERDLVVVSDEIHSDLLFDNRTHRPIASLGPEIAERTITLTSASKSFNLPGLRCAVAHFGHPSLQERFNTVIHRHIRGGLGLLGLYASMAAWRHAQPWLDEVVPYLAANRDFAEKRLAERIPEIRFHRPEATYLAWLDCRALPQIQAAAPDRPPAPAAYFLRNGKVALTEGRAFGEGWDGYARLNFATSRPILTEVIERMARAIGR